MSYPLIKEHQKSNMAAYSNKFIRRGDLTPLTLLHIAFTALQVIEFSIWGNITFVLPALWGTDENNRLYH